MEWTKLLTTEWSTGEAIGARDAREIRDEDDLNEILGELEEAIEETVEDMAYDEMIDQQLADNIF
jgi:ArsR family metal-binding transcriptional regulator